MAIPAPRRLGLSPNPNLSPNLSRTGTEPEPEYDFDIAVADGFFRLRRSGRGFRKISYDGDAQLEEHVDRRYGRLCGHSRLHLYRFRTGDSDFDGRVYLSEVLYGGDLAVLHRFGGETYRRMWYIGKHYTDDEGDPNVQAAAGSPIRTSWRRAVSRPTTPNGRRARSSITATVPTRSRG